MRKKPIANNWMTWLVAAILGCAPSAVAAQEHPGHAPPSQTAADPAPCLQGAQQALGTVERAKVRVEAARQTNSPPELRAAIDDLQSALAQLSAQLEPCAQAVMPMDHSKMTMPGMDHSKMAMPTTSPEPGARKPPAGTPSMPMDHSKMGHAMPAPSQAPAEQKRSAATPKPMDHSKMATASSSPKPGAAKLPVMPAEKILDARCAKTIDLKTAPKATYQGKVYYFCSTADRDRFRKDPEAYLRKPPK